MSLIEPIPVPLAEPRVLRGRGHLIPSPLPGSERLRISILRADRLGPHEHARWAKLTAHAAPGNVLASEWCLGPVLAHRAGRGLRIAIAENAAGGWAGMLPLAQQAIAGKAWLRGWRSWPAPAGAGVAGLIGTPLLRVGAERAFWEALLAHLDSHPGMAAGLFADALPLDDPATLSLISLCAEQGRPLHGWGGFARPVWRAESPAGARAVAILGARLDANAARLAAAHGPLQLVRHRHAEDCEPWLAAFLALERRGGGLGRTAFEPATLRAVVAAGQQRGAVRLASLAAGETIVAMAAWLVSGGHGYVLGIAIDPRARIHAPHRLLMRRIADGAAGEGLLRFDSGAAADCVPGPLWPAQRRFARFAIGIGGPLRRAMLGRAMAALDSGVAG